MKPYFEDESVKLYLGDAREVLPVLAPEADLICTDPPYGETSLAWDRWVDGWPTLAAQHSRSMWCFGSMRMFGEHWGEFGAAKWKLSQDVVWQKNNGTGLATDRFRRIHEIALHWYRGDWGSVRHEVPRVDAPPEGTPGRARTRVGESFTRVPTPAAHLGSRGASGWTDDGTRLATSIIRAKNLRGRAIHPTEKPVELLRPLIEYACPPGGLVLDLFAGSGAILDAARQTGRRAIGIEADERYAERAARRLSQGVLDLGGVA